MAKKKDEQKRADLFEASIKILSSKNFHEISVEDIIKKAGVGKSTFYSTYKTKEIWYDQIRSDVSEMYWESLIRHYAKMKDKTFSVKMRHLAVYLILYTRRSVDYRRVTKGQMMWRTKFDEMIDSESEEQKLFNKDLNDYAMKMKIDPEEVRMNVHLLLTSAVQYGYAAAEQKINVPFSIVKESVSYSAGQLFPEE
ncbi:MAG: TetR/AcrR family transcriptional regulator [Solobacterium sp.]|nr:TetR/AcrR family transcriptional regulator [Solobacterium sp.]